MSSESFCNREHMGLMVIAGALQDPVSAGRHADEASECATEARLVDKARSSSEFLD